jgi:biopolymer transport protein ExbD/biopolymer transport protein TolR
MGAPSTFPLPRKARAQIKPEINVTPLVDVVLVLLIIFMVIAPQLESGDRVELPAIANPDKTAKLDALTLTVTASERYLLEKVPVEAADLGKELARAHLEAPQKRIVIKGDRGLPYATMRRVFGQAQDIGFPGVALMVDQKKGAHAPAAGEE